MVGVAKYVIDGDVGCGSFNSPSWHRAAILQSEDFKAYIKLAFNKDVETLDEALEVIDGYSQGSGRDSAETA